MKLEEKSKEELIEIIELLQSEISSLEGRIEERDDKVYVLEEELKEANRHAQEGVDASNLIFHIKHTTGVDLLGYHDVEWELSLEETLRNWNYERC